MSVLNAKELHILKMVSSVRHILHTHTHKLKEQVLSSHLSMARPEPQGQ